MHERSEVRLLHEAETAHLVTSRNATATTHPHRSILDPLPMEVIVVPISPLRAKLASFDHAYAVALRLRRVTGRLHYVVETRNPMQPYRVTDRQPPRPDRALAMIA